MRKTVGERETIFAGWVLEEVGGEMWEYLKGCTVGWLGWGGG